MTTVIPNVFVAGTKAKAEEVNENFEVLAEAVNKQHENIQALVDNSLEELENTKEEILAEINETQVGNMAHLTLDNLDEEGKSVIISQSQHKPFSISNGAVDKNGRNGTLHKISEPITVEQEYVFEKTLASTVLGGETFAVDSSPYTSDVKRLFNKYNVASMCTLDSLPASITFYAPEAIKVQKLEIMNGFNSTDEAIKEYNIYGSNDNEYFSLLKSGTNENSENSQTWEINLAENTLFFKYYKIEIVSTYGSTSVGITNIDITATYHYTYNTNSTIICAPCTITTADGRTKTFENTSILELKTSYEKCHIYKSFSDGNLSFSKSLSIGKTAPAILKNYTIIGNAQLGIPPNSYLPGYTKFGNGFYISALDFEGFNPSSSWQLDFYFSNCYTAGLNDNKQVLLSGINLRTKQYSFQLYIAKGNNLKFDIYNSSGTVSATLTVNLAGNSYEDFHVTIKYDETLSDNYTYEMRVVRFNTSNGKDTVINANSIVKTTISANNIQPITKLIFGVDYDVKGDKISVTANALAGYLYDKTSIKNNGKVYWVSNEIADKWLDTSSVPYTLLNKNGLSWEADNDSVYLGYVQLGLDDIEAIRNVEFDKDYSSNARVIETFDYKTSGYRIYSDGYCEQWGRFLTPALANNAVTLLKTMRDTDYQIFLQDVGGVGGTNTTILSSTEDGFVFYISRNGSSAVCTETKWRVCGYLAEDQY